MRTYKRIIGLLCSVIVMVIGLMLSPFQLFELSVQPGLYVVGGAIFGVGAVGFGFMVIPPLFDWFES